MRKLIAIVTAVMLASGPGVALAQQRCDQGFPGTFGAWSVTLTNPAAGGVTATVSTTPTTCTTPTHKITSVGVTAVNTPSSQLASRRFVTLTNSPENSGSPKVKCRIDGVAPVMGNTNAGDVLTLGSSITYAVGAAVTPQCISDTASTAVISLECV